MGGSSSSTSTSTKSGGGGGGGGGASSASAGGGGASTSSGRSNKFAVPILAAESDKDVIGTEEEHDSEELDDQSRLPVPGIQQPSMERRKRSVQKPKLKRNVTQKNLKRIERSPVVPRKGKAVLQEPPFIRRMQMEEYKRPEVPQKMLTTEFNPNDIIWAQLDRKEIAKPPKAQPEAFMEAYPLKDERVTLFDKLSEFMYDDMDVVMDYLEENGSPVVSYMSGRVGDIMHEVNTNMEEH